MVMQKFDVMIALEKVAEMRAKWTSSKREFDEGINQIMRRLLHEAANNYMSVDEVAKSSGYKPLQVRSMMRLNGLDPREGKTLLAKHAAKALAENADLLGISVHDMDLMSPLAYLPMGEQLKQQLLDARVARVTELSVTPEEAWDEWAADHGVHRTHPTMHKAFIAGFVSGNAEEDARDIEHYSELAQRYHDLLVKLGFCTRCADGSTMPCDNCGAGL